ncbi:TraI/MobA(P) family conjugative relaxase [Fundidesulfovibrio putealis]|uniref:TraI/MobA(P) family conjugative relaxase n=1 Tax=Fundidesulfovibrio putealis TaxID=270496 RepID=UPI000416A62B|nr:TraI/MobA(P) family conjugative relaxase [Fundidesulfovibrio putealis]
MISRRVPRKPENDDYRRLARYIAAADHLGEKSLMHWCAGCLAGDDYALGIQEAVDTQAMNTRTSKEKTYHLIVSFRPEDEARLTPEMFMAIEEEFAETLGFSEHQRHCGIHKNTNNLHMHVAYNMIHPERLTRHEPYQDFIERDSVCRDLEQRFGLAIDNGRGVEKEAPQLNDIAATVEAHTGQQSFEGYAKERRERLLDALAQAADWEQVHAAFAGCGMEIKPHGNGLVIKDRNGDLAIKASRLDRSLSLSKLTKHFGTYIRPGLTKEHYLERERFTSKPLHRGSERGDLYREYQQGIEPRKMIMEELANRQVKELETHRAIWNLEREIINRQFFGQNRYDLLKIARLTEIEQRLQIQKKIRVEQEKARKDTPYASWTDFLRWKTTLGNETALAILRSKGDLVEPEATPGASNVNQRQEVREKWIETQLHLVAEQAVSRRARRGLLAIARAHELAELESVVPRANRLFTGFTSSIDASGTVFIHLANGGMIRDMGKEVAFTAHDAATKEAALQFVRLKWGKAIRMEGNVIRFKSRNKLIEFNLER